ncbi:MAG: phosphomannomutase/phosphoglucomutase [Planctomycetes bacterium]|nr:phosphomannomutase/phosphoglucomutase [Planctomycetota bacterium]
MGIFKAYDIRGLVGKDLDETIARRIGNAFALDLGAKTLVIGRDMRSHSPAIQSAIIEGVRDAGCDVIDIGLASTPMAYFAIGSLACDGGLNVTASHNGPAWNGFKLCRSGARPVSYETGIGQIEKRVVSSAPISVAPKRGSIRKEEVLGRYLDHLLKFAPKLAPMRIVVDAANGMAGFILPELSKKLAARGVELVPMFWDLDGNFPNHEANPLKPDIMEILAKEVRRHPGRFAGGASFDGDADRCAFVDEKGTPIANDLMTAMLSRELLAKNPGSAIIYDLRSSWVVPETITKSGGRPIRERVGHSFIKETMRREKGVFGGELSGHYYWRDHFYSDSAMVAFMHVLQMLSDGAAPLSERADGLRKYFATGEINFEVADKRHAIELLKHRFGSGAARIDELDGITIEFGRVDRKPWWWFNVRPSNTEPLLRLNLEASDAALRDEKSELIVSLLGKPVH